MYVYTNLSAALRDKTSPLREYLHDRFPHTRGVQAEYRREARPLLVGTGGANPATLGAAFDFEIRFLLVPEHAPVLPLLGFFGHPRESAVIESVIETAQAAVAPTASSPSHPPTPSANSGNSAASPKNTSSPTCDASPTSSPPSQAPPSTSPTNAKQSGTSSAATRYSKRPFPVSRKGSDDLGAAWGNRTPDLFITADKRYQR